MKTIFRNVYVQGVLFAGALGLMYYAGRTQWLIGAKMAPASQVISHVNHHPPSRKADSLEQVEALIADMLADKWPNDVKSNSDRSRFFRTLLRDGAIDPKDIPDLVAYLHSMSPGDDAKMMIYELLGRLAGNAGPNLEGANPALALQLLQDLDDSAERQELLGIAIMTMAATNPKQALAELQKLPPGATTNKALAGIFSAWMKVDPVGAASFADSMPLGSERDQVLQGIIQTWGKSDPQAAIKWALNLPPGNSAILANVINRVAMFNPQLAADNVAKIPDLATRNSAIQQIIADTNTPPSYLGNNPTAELKWLNQAATGVAYSDAIAYLFSALSDPPVREHFDIEGNEFGHYNQHAQDLDKAVSLLATLTDPVARSAAITSMADGWSLTDPQAALAWAQSLPASDGSSRAGAITTVLTNWIQSDPVNAVAYVQNTPNQSILLASAPELAQAMAISNPQAALTWANSLPDGVNKTVALSNVLTNEAQSDFTDAWNYAANLTQSAAQATVMANLVAAEASKNPAQATTLISQIPDETSQLKAVGSVSALWVKQDPQAFTVWLNGLPPGDVRDTAIVQLASSAQTTKNPEGVLAWVNTISNPQTKAALLQKLAPTSTGGGN